MKFTQKSLGDAANISTGREGALRDYRRIFLFVLVGLVLMNLAVWAAVEIAVRFISFEQEAAMFGGLFWADEDENDDPALRPFQEVFDVIRTHPDVPPIKFRLRRMESKDPNAFAVIGGVIAVTDGLIEAIEEDEIAIAFLLGHELGHFHNRDHLRGAGRALLLAGCQRVFFPYGGGDLVGGMTHAAIVTAYSRKQEEEADRFGLRLVYETYGSTDGAIRLFELLDDERRLPEWAYMFTTHPGPQTRIQRLRAELVRMTSGNEKTR